jgi:ubiquinone/menaquinone biosynthesis C-methylase UbiE
MSKNLLLEEIQDYFRKNLIKYTRKAFRMLPELEKPRILDIGCGSGIPTIELARLSDGEIIGIDIDDSLLEKLDEKIEEEGFSDRVRIRKCSLFGMDFPDESFDIIWAEGSIHIIGFERGLREWKRLLKTNGFLVVHDDIKAMSDKLKKIPDCGYKLINHFSLPEDAWWIEYYQPLEIQIKQLSIKYNDDPEALKILKKSQNGIDAVKKSPKKYGSVFCLMQKIQES